MKKSDMKKEDAQREEAREPEQVERELAAYEELRKEIENEIYMIPRDVIVKMVGVVACLAIAIILLVIYDQHKMTAI